MKLVASIMHEMSPQRTNARHEVGIRKLRDRLSRYLREVADGGEVIVTDRGRRVARISSLEADDPLDDLKRRGLVQEPRRSAWEPRRRRPRVKASVSDLVAEQRR